VIDGAASDGRLPTFLVIGAMKSGTSSLRDYLRAHPDVYVPPEEELHYFAEGINWAKGLDWYRSRFADAGTAIAVGEKSPTYAMVPEHPGVPERIAALLPDVRLLYVVREPIARIRSHFVHQFGRGHEHLRIARAVREDPRYLDTTRYAMQLERYLDWFPAEQLMVITSEQLDHERAATFRRIAAFCGVDPDVELEALDQRSHESGSKQVPVGVTARLRNIPALRKAAEALPAPVRSRIGAATRRELQPDELELDASTQAWIIDQLRPDLVGLRRWLGEDFAAWGYAD
jgi:hypothetical protein